MNILKISAVIVTICRGSVIAQANDKSYEADVVVYGVAAGGVTAAVQATRMGKKVILVAGLCKNSYGMSYG